MVIDVEVNVKHCNLYKNSWFAYVNNVRIESILVSRLIFNGNVDELKR